MASKVRVDWKALRNALLIVLIPALGLATCVAMHDKSGKKGADRTPKLADQLALSACPAGATATGTVYRPVRSVFLYESWDLESKQVNARATRATGKTHYLSVDGSTKVAEVCTYQGRALVSIIDPEWLAGIKGWAAESQLKEKLDPLNPYEGKIAEYIYSPLGDEYYEGGGARFVSRRNEIDGLMVRAAEKALKSEKCDYVEGVIFSHSTSSQELLKFVVDCAGGSRFIITTDDLDSADAVLSESEKSISNSAASRQCRALVLNKYRHAREVLFPGRSGSGYYQAPVTGNVVYTIPFSIVLADGRVIKKKARCIFDTGGRSELNVINELN